MTGYWRQRRAANQAARRAQASRQQLLTEAGKQQSRWQRRTPWLLPLTLLAGYLLGRAKPGRQLWQWGQGLLQVSHWLARGAMLSKSHQLAARQPATAAQPPAQPDAPAA